MVKNKLSNWIDKSQKKQEDEARNYIGASSIGSECLRQIWYQFKGFKSEGVASKTIRTWEIGKNLEGLVIDWLINSGITVFTLNVTYYSKNVQSFQGHIDGLVVIDNKNYILEIKTAKNSSFNIFIKNGLKVWNPQYYAQIQSYMGMSSILSTYILVLNKDNSELSDELVTFDGNFYKNLEEKALMISRYESEPPRVNNSPLFFKCKMCQFNKECHR